MAFSRALGPAPHRRVLDLIRAIPAVDVQNRLLKIGDKDLATSLLYMAEGEQTTVMQLLGHAKGNRVTEELKRQNRSRIGYEHYEQAVRIVIRALEGERVEGPRTYYRPSRS